ncbi:phage protein [Photobacterium aphoticum]|uniref:S-adenosylhomocysteine hydrolase n=1 Tax=Photobacterium aphoticum TaxID=754436 RepID=A0A0J1JJ11_9GAMM|nr:phage protein [Photobacterium aphoticum]KLV02002.1 S-adenosylhomocysteine hydrolase [Photobacterium aphoticum]PSU60248.1 S-adenosylhomocysteine hydrolase [Photobacterium aphoticum]GHA34348.1 S-adenosylhomocysteine hydrolase [Photobacterium aphoticum]
MLHHSFKELFWRNFDSIPQAAAWFHVRDITVKRWLSGEVDVNPMAEKLLIIRARGYMPDDTRWRGFRIDEEYCVIITPEGRRLTPSELMSWATRADEYHTLKRLYELDYVPVRSHVVAQLPFRGGRRINEPLHETISKQKKKQYRQIQAKHAEKKRRNQLS